jgi:FtsH-binding integral membrane protein
MEENPQDGPVQHRHHKMLPVWFFIGVLLLVYGIIILWTSLARFHDPSNVILANYHAGVWGGALLILLGGGYTLKFRPRSPK